MKINLNLSFLSSTALLTTLMFSPLGWGEIQERITAISDTEKAEFDKNFEDRIARDIKAYLNSDRFVFSVNTELERVESFDVQEKQVERYVPKEQSPNIPQQAPALPPAAPPMTPNVTNDQVFAQMDLGQNVGQNIEFSLPGLPSPDVRLAPRAPREQNQVPVPMPVAPTTPQAQAFQPSAPAMEKVVETEKTESLVESKVRIKKMRMRLILDEKATQEQEVFLRNLIVDKAGLSFLRGDELNVSRAPFPEEKKPEEQPKLAEKPAEVEPAEVEPAKPLTWQEQILANWYWWLIALMAVIILWLALRKNDTSEASKEGFVPPVEVPSLADLVLQDADTLKAKAQIQALKEHIVNLAVSDPEVVRHAVQLMSSSSEELDKAKLVVLYSAMGESLFSNLFKSSLNREQIARIGYHAREINQTQGLSDQVPIMEEVYKSIMELHYKAKDKSDQNHKPFAFLSKLDVAQITYLLSEEDPPIKALVMSQLPAQTASIVMNSYEEAQRNAVIAEVSQFRNMPLESFRDVANRLAKKAQSVPSFDKIAVDGVDLLVGMLDYMDTAAETALLTSLEKDNPDLYYQIRKVYLTFADIARIPSVSLKNLVREFDRDQLVLALSDMDDSYRQNLINALPERPKAMVTTLLNQFSTTDQQAVANAKRLLTQKARALLKAGVFTMEDLTPANS